MAACEITDIFCVLVNEVFGTGFLFTLFAMLGLFYLGIKQNWNFNVVLFLLIPLGLIISLATGTIDAWMAVITFIIAMAFAWMINKALGNR